MHLILSNTRSASVFFFAFYVGPHNNKISIRKSKFILCLYLEVNAIGAADFDNPRGLSL